MSPGPDGRAPGQLRPVAYEVGYQEWAAGSVLFSMGKTRVLCAASVSTEAPRWLGGREGMGHGRVLDAAGVDHGAVAARGEPRASRRPNPGDQRLIGRSLRAVTDLGSLGERTMRSTATCCRRTRAPGRRRSRAGTWRSRSRWRLAEDGVVPAVRRSVAAVSVGIVDGEARLDLSTTKDASAEVDCNVVMTGSGALVEVQGTAEGAPFDRSQLDELLDLAAGVAELTKIQRGSPRRLRWRSRPDRDRVAQPPQAPVGRICAAWPVAWATVDDGGPWPDVEETGDTYLENAAEGAGRGGRPRRAGGGG